MRQLKAEADFRTLRGFRFPERQIPSRSRSDLRCSLAPCFAGRETGPEVLESLKSEVFFDFRLQPLFVSAGGSQGTQPFEESSKPPHFRSSAYTAKKRPMIAAVCSQPWVSARNCLRPSRVSR